MKPGVVVNRSTRSYKSILKDTAVSTTKKKRISFSSVCKNDTIDITQPNLTGVRRKRLKFDHINTNNEDNNHGVLENIPQRAQKRILLHDTICLDSSDDTDVINESFTPVTDKFKTPKQSGRSTVSDSLQYVLHTQLMIKDDTTTGSKRYNLRNSGSPESKNQSLKSLKVNKIKFDTTPIKLDEEVIKEEIIIHEPVLSLSKRNDIQKWLNDNENINTINTPQFDDILDSPVGYMSSDRICRSAPPKTKHKMNESDCSSVDSDVHQVLTEIYGNDWKNKRLSQVKTEPKKQVTRTMGSIKKNTKRNLLFTGVSNSDCSPSTSTNKKSLKSRETSVDRSDCCSLQSMNSYLSLCQNDKIILSGKRSRSKSSNSDESWQPAKRKKIKESRAGKTVKTPKTPKLDVPTLTKNIRSNYKTPTNKFTPKPVQNIEATPKKTFLASLSTSTPNSRCHPEAYFYKLNFKTKKEELAQKLFKLYNKQVFDECLADDMDISWNVKLRGTAGFCYNKRHTSGKGEVTRSSRIELSTKVIDRADRLRDTLLHELCHAASWIVDGSRDGHGPGWQKWARKAMERFPELPVVKRCHNYEIATKFTYRCTGCGYSINRHSKSIDIGSKRCGYCYGRLELLVNKKRRGKGEKPEFDTTRTVKAPTAFALFVKQNYHSVKESNSNIKHGEIMKILSKKYNLVKNGTPKYDVKKS